MLTKDERKIHPGSAISVSSYLKNKSLTEEDKVWIAQIRKPKGWSERFINIEGLSDDEILARGEILGRIKKFPTIKVKIN